MRSVVVAVAWTIAWTPAWAGTTYAPGAGVFGAVMFEDQWPARGDFDFNDVVIRYNVVQEDDGLGATTALTVTLDVGALGSQSVCSGLALRLPVAPGAIDTATFSFGTPGSGAPWDFPSVLEKTASGGDAVLWIADDVRALCPATGFINTQRGVGSVDCRPITLDIHLATPTVLPAAAPYDLFVHHCGDRSVQIHRPAYGGTVEADGALYGTRDDASAGATWYVDTVGIPFGLHIAEGGTPSLVGDDLGWPSERTRVDLAWPSIVAFAQSGGTTHTDYYADGAVDRDRMFDQPELVALPIRDAQADLVDVGGGVRGWSDGTFAVDCEDYRYPASGHGYSGFTGDGKYRVNPGSGTTDVFCDMTTDGGGWTMLYKRSAGVVVADLPGEIGAGPLNATNPALLDRDRETVDYVSALTSSAWSQFDEARVEVVTGGVVQQWIHFSTLNTTPTTFLSVGKVNDSSWTDLAAGPHNFFGIAGQPSNQRYWFINGSYGGCPTDYGWLVAQGGYDDCAASWGHLWAVQYSTLSTKGRWGVTTADADALIVFARRGQPGKSQGQAGATCEDLMDDGIATVDGRYFVDPDGPSGSEPFQTFCDVAGGGWTLAYKKSSGAVGDPAVDWFSGARRASDFSLMDREQGLGDLANPAITTGWSAFTEARVEILVDGAPVRTLAFSTSGTTNDSWFTPAKLVSSPWTDLIPFTGNYFGIAADTTNHRHFFLNYNYGGCEVDQGWLVVPGSTLPCAWETANTVQYAIPSTRQNWTTGSIGVADAFAVFLR